MSQQPCTADLGHAGTFGTFELTFYEFSEERPPECDGVIPFPPQMDGFVFIAFHGSWNREIPTGYKVVYVPTNADGSIQGGIGANRSTYWPMKVAMRNGRITFARLMSTLTHVVVYWFPPMGSAVKAA
jgi:hypothetical protein